MDPVSGNSGSGSVSSVGSLGTCTSVNFIFAKLQMELAASAKDSALGYIKQIEGAQAEQKEVADMLQRCRELQNQAKDSGGCTEMPADVREFMDKNNLTYDLTTGGVSKPTKETADSLHNKDEWDVAIQSLQAYQETIGTDIQTKMVYVQDFMGQYNSYTQGANSAIQSGMLDGRVRSLRVRVVLAHEVLHINHQRLDVRTDGFLICLKGLDCDIPLVFAQNIIFIRVWES